ncbi:MAG: hypothetical protein EBZ77_13925 [Chitinophagia bacterium]|nr:hypothetical protein [Chitinophagia bacterium]
MKRQLSVFLLLLLLAVVVFPACKGRPDKRKAIKEQLIGHSSSIDTSMQSFYDNKLYVANIIRFKHKFGKAFVYVDTVKSTPGKWFLQPAEREPFYIAEDARINGSDRAAYQYVWDLPEIQALQVGDGGYGTVYAFIGVRPVKDTGYYIMEIRKNNIQEFPLHQAIGSVKFNLRTHEAWVGDPSGYYVPLSTYRAAQR